MTLATSSSRTARRDDRGAAMVFAIGVALVSVSMLSTLSIYTVGEARQSGKLRQLSAAYAAAEGQADLYVAKISSAASAGTALPCASSTVTESTTGADAFSITTSVAYKDSSGTAVTACPLPSGQQLGSAVVRSVATGPTAAGTAPARRVVEATLRITGGSSSGTSGGTMPRAIFADSDLLLSGASTLTTSGGSAPPVPSIYTNDTFQCAVGLQLPGDLVAQFDTSLQGGQTCSVGGNLATWGSLSMGNTTARVTGNVTAKDNITITNGANVGGTVKAGGTISWSGCGTKCTAHATLTRPTWEYRPDIPWNAAARTAWQNAGWTVVTFDNSSDCTVTNGLNAPGWWLTNNASGTQRTVMHTICRLPLTTQAWNYDLGHDLAVIADGGIAFAQNLHVLSSTGSPSLYFIQPSTTTNNCTTGITVNGAMTIDSNVPTLFYTPCDFLGSQAFSIPGQVYGRSVTFSSSLALTYKQLSVPGLTTSGGSAGGTTTTSGYTVAVVGKSPGS